MAKLHWFRKLPQFFNTLFLRLHLTYLDTFGTKLKLKDYTFRFNFYFMGKIICCPLKKKIKLRMMNSVLKKWARGAPRCKPLESKPQSW